MNSLVNIVNQEMPIITEWLASNKLNVNVGKSTAMLFHSRPKIINTVDKLIKINNTTLPFSISTKFLDMYIDNNLTWNAHTKQVDKKIQNEWVSAPALEINYLIKFYSSFIIH